MLKELLMQCGLDEEPTNTTTTTPSSPKRLRQPHVLDYMPHDSQEEEKLDGIQEVDFAPVLGNISECERDAYTVHALHLISREELKLFVLEHLTFQVLREIAHNNPAIKIRTKTATIYNAETQTKTRS